MVTIAQSPHPPRVLCTEPGMYPLHGYRPVAVPRCARCLDEGHVCEDHPEFPWEDNLDGERGRAGLRVRRDDRGKDHAGR